MRKEAYLGKQLAGMLAHLLRGKLAVKKHKYLGTMAYVHADSRTEFLGDEPEKYFWYQMKHN